MRQPPSLYKSLSRTLVLIAVLPLFFLGLVILYHLIISSTEQIKEKNQMLARAISGQVEALLKSPLTTLNNLRFQLEEKAGDQAERSLVHALNQHVEYEQFFNSIYLLSREGLISLVGLSQQRNSLREEFRQLNLSHLNFYQHALHTQTVTWSDTFHSLISGNTSVAICVPLRDGRSLIGNINIDFLQTMLDRISLAESVETTILDRRGEVIAASNPQQTDLATNLLHLQLVRQGLRGEENNRLYLDNGTSRLGSVALISGTGWLTLISQPTSLAYRPLTHAGILLGVGIVTVLIVSIFFAIRKARRVARPFLELSQHADAVAAGNYALPPLDPAFQEVAALDANFRQMAGAIQQREMALMQREQEYRTLAENLPAIVYRICLKENNRLILRNSFHHNLTGYTGEEMLAGGTGLYASRIHPEDFVDSRQLVNEAIKTHKAYSIEYRFRHRTGAYRHFIEHGSAICGADGQPEFLDGVVFDNSEQQRAQEVLLQTEKMMSVGGLAAGMAHEINNPLAGILLNMELIRQRLNPQREANRKRAREHQLGMDQVEGFLSSSRILGMLDSIDEATKRTAKIVENVLSFSRKDSGEYARESIKSLIEQTLQLAEHNFDLKKGVDFKKISIRRHYASQLPSIYCQPSQIQQVLLNILENAAQAMFENTAELREPEIWITSRTENQWLCLEIRDNGPGMETAISRRIFEPFFTTKDAGKGTGLGLSVSYFIITKNHHGRLSVESTPGVGSTFTILLPVAYPQRAEGPQK